MNKWFYSRRQPPRGTHLDLIDSLIGEIVDGVPNFIRRVGKASDTRNQGTVAGSDLNRRIEITGRRSGGGRSEPRTSCPFAVERGPGISPELIASRTTLSRRCFAEAAPWHIVYPQSRKVRAERAAKRVCSSAGIVASPSSDPLLVQLKWVWASHMPDINVRPSPWKTRAPPMSSRVSFLPTETMRLPLINTSPLYGSLPLWKGLEVSVRRERRLRGAQAERTDVESRIFTSRKATVASS